MAWSLLSIKEIELTDICFYVFVDVMFRYQEDVSLEDAIHTAILVLKDGFEGNMTSDCLEIGVLTHCPLAKASDSTLPEYQELATVPSFRVLSDSEISDYLANL